MISPVSLGLDMESDLKTYKFIKNMSFRNNFYIKDNIGDNILKDILYEGIRETANIVL